MKTIELTKKDFAWTKWGAEDLEKAVKEIIAEKKKRYDEIKKIPASERTFENTVYAIESSDYAYESVFGYIHTLSSIALDKKVRDSARKAEEELSKKLVDIEYDEKLYLAVKEYLKNQKKLKENLCEEDKKLLKDMLRGYKRMGFDLQKDKQKELKKILKQKSKLSTQFSKNINEWKDFILVTKDELDGLPERYVDGLQKDKKSGKYKVTLEYPDLIPFMANAKSEKKRKELAEKELQKGGKKNIEILKKALSLRDKSAKLLGYKNYADFVTEERMAKSSKKVYLFLNTLIKKVEKGAREELTEFAKMKEKDSGKKCNLPEHYDIAYYSNMLKKKKFDIDPEALREYFPLEHVKKEIFVLFGNLFGIKFEKLKGYPLWHKDVELYAIKENGKIISYFTFDLFPREGKYGHACVQDITHSKNINFNSDERSAPFACLITNFLKPSKKHPSLLTLGDVETFLHEFGHILHHSLSKSKYSSQSGFNVAWDFVEVPSQILENWIWDKKMLKRFSKHYKNGKSLDDKTIRNILKSKLHGIKYFVLRQNILALFDMELHTKKIKSTTTLYNKLVKRYTGIKMPKDNIFPARFAHIMGGYSAGYYSYMWALVFADDMFSKFKKAGLQNKKVGAEYKRWILEKGSSMDEMKLVKNFLGRKANNKAFLKGIGI